MLCVIKIIVFNLKCIFLCVLNIFYKDWFVSYSNHAVLLSMLTFLPVPGEMSQFPIDSSDLFNNGVVFAGDGRVEYR